MADPATPLRMSASPTVVVEVLSKTTERHDRGDKWPRTSASPPSPTTSSSRSMRRASSTTGVSSEWRYSVHGAGDTFQLASGATLVVDALYEGVFELPSD